MFLPGVVVSDLGSDLEGEGSVVSACNPHFISVLGAVHLSHAWAVHSEAKWAFLPLLYSSEKIECFSQTN